MSKLQFKNFLWYILSFVFKNLLPLLILPLLTRYLTVEDFGLYALSLFYGIFGAGVINLGLLGIFERNFFELKPLDRKNTLFTILIFVIMNMFILLLITYSCAEKISIHIFQESQISDLLIWALIFQSFKSFNQYFFTYFKNYENARAFTFLAIFESIISLLTGVLFVIYLDNSTFGFILGQALGVMTVFLVSFIYLFYPFKYIFVIPLLKEQLKLSLPLTPRLFFGLINSQFDRYMLGLLGSVGGVGLYDIGQKIANTSFTFMTTIQNVFAPQVYKRFFSEDIKIKKSIGAYLNIFLYICILVCMLVGIFSYEFLYLFMPEEFHGAAPIISVLSLLYGFYFFGKQPQLIYAKKTGLISIISLATIGLNVGFNIPMIHFFGVMGAAWATAIAGISSTAIIFFYGQKYAPIYYEKKVLKVLGVFVLSILGTLYIDFIKADYIISFSFKLSMIILYVSLGWYYKFFDLKELKQQLLKIVENQKN